MTSKGYTFTPESNLGSANDKKYTFTSEDSLKKGYSPQKEAKEGFLKSSGRLLSQLPQAALEATPPGIASSLFQLMAMGESDLGVEEWHKLRELAEQEGKQFNDESYEEARQQMLGMIPTVHNIAGKIEEETGAPLTPKEWYEKALRLGSLSGALTKGTPIQKLVSGGVSAGGSEALQALGVPEPFAELTGLAAGQIGGAKTPPLELGKARKPSGIPERQFENLKSPHEVSQSKLTQINEKLESDFKEVSNRIIKESPVGETFENLKNDPSFKQQSRELLNDAQKIADLNPSVIPTKAIKKEYADFSSKRMKGFALDEADKSYMKYMKEAIQDILAEKTTYGELVEMYRKNNRGLSEAFEPGSSKAVNRAKKDALLDQNRAIANIIDKGDSELSSIFKTGNEQWSKIMDAERVDSFIDDIFKDKVNFKEIDKFFDKNGYEFTFKRALGDKGYKDFTQLLKDMSITETPYKMLKVARKKGFSDLYKTGTAFFLHPNLGAAKLAIDAAKAGYKGLFNAIIDKPKLGITLKKGMQDLKKGDFKAAEQEFKSVEAEIEESPKQAMGEPAKAAREETIDFTPKKIEGKESQPKQIEHKPKKQLAEPKLIEYKPKPIGKQSLKERSESIARDSFKEVIEGNPISNSQKYHLKNVEVSLLQTRGKGEQFHGSRKPIKEMNPEIYDVSGEQNIYGAGFYTTDALDIADGYSKAKKSKTPTVYKVSEKTPQKIYDSEKPMSKEVRDKLKYYIEEYGEATTVRDIYDNITDQGEGLPTYEVQEALDGVSSELQNLGYEGMSHKGGILTNNPEHKVKIYWKPENLEIQEFSYPKEFKKISKTAKPTELPATLTRKKSEIPTKTKESTGERIENIIASKEMPISEKRNKLRELGEDPDILGIKEKKPIKFEDEITGTNKNEKFGEYRAMIQEKPVGVIDYSILGDEITINHIEVRKDLRRKGIATEMLNSFKKDLGNGKKIKISNKTEEGSKFFKSINKKKKS